MTVFVPHKLFTDVMGNIPDNHESLRYMLTDDVACLTQSNRYTDVTGNIPDNHESLTYMLTYVDMTLLVCTQCNVEYPRSNGEYP